MNSSWTLTQWVCLVLGFLFLAHAAGGMVVNPDFAVGSAATAERWLLMDWNGWHALSGLLLWNTSIVVAFRADWARMFALFVAIAQLPVVVWMLFDPRPLGLFLLPTTTDLIFHSATVLLFACLFVFDRPRDAETGAASAAV